MGPAASAQALAHAWSAHDADGIAARYAKDGVLRIPGYADFNGPDAIRTQAKAAFAGSSDMRITSTRSWENVKGHIVAAEWVATGTDDGGQMGAKPTNKPTGTVGISIITFGDDGLIKEDRRYFDMTTQQSQLDPKSQTGTYRPVPSVPTSGMEMYTSNGSPDEKANLDAANGMYQALDDHKLDGALGFIADTASLDDYSQPAMISGKAGVKGYLGELLGAFPDLKQARNVQLTADAYVVTEGVLTGTQRGKLGPLKPSGKAVSLHFVDVMQMQDGKVVHGWSYANGVELLVAVGVMKPFMPAAAH
jgi:ketosteroid isomerase-like protein